jgi:hypothetical protein
VAALLIVLGLLPLQGCSAPETDPAQPPSRSTDIVGSVYTDLAPGSCRQEIDKDDPNETPYLSCPGVAGYALIVRRVEAGRRSINVVDAAQRVHPLNLHEVVTRHMSSVSGRAEWRVATREGAQVPIALIVRVEARENSDDPGKVTRSYLAVAKISANEACVTDRIPEGAQSEEQVRRVADSALERPCASPQPLLTPE